MLLIDKSIPAFDLDEITRGSVVYAKKDVWDEGICGIVTEIDEDQMRIQYLPPIRNVINHCVIRASQVAVDMWELRYSNDMLETVTEYPAAEETK